MPPTPQCLPSSTSPICDSPGWRAVRLDRAAAPGANFPHRAGGGPNDPVSALFRPVAVRDTRQEETMTLQLTPLHPLFAAEVGGLDLRQTPGPELCTEIDRAMDRYAVLVFRNQQLDDDQQMAFGEALGPLEQTRGTVDAHKHRLKHGQMNDISNIDVDGKLLGADDRRRMFNLGNQLWHSDSSFKATPAKYSMLHARLIPPEGGETEFADMRAAWDALPEKT